MKDYQKWIRLDARENKPGVNAQFSIETEQLAFPVRPNMGKIDGFVVYTDPDRTEKRVVNINISAII